jgi:hypothetical protein
MRSSNIIEIVKKIVSEIFKIAARISDRSQNHLRGNIKNKGR